MSNGGAEPLFLTLEQVLAFHHQQIELFGGAHGIIDEGLLDSALNQPQTTWCYNSAADLFDLAAAYAFHLSKNHPFRDGNKRVALHTALAFLRLNAVRIVATENEMFEAMSQLVTDVIDKPQFAAFLRSIVLGSIDPMPVLHNAPMSLRLQMLQIARVAPKVLGDSADLVRAFFVRQFSPAGGAVDRAGQPDLYYTIFALAGLQAMQADDEIASRRSPMADWLGSFGEGGKLDFIHLSALARCWAALGAEKLPASLATAMLARIETYRSRDGGYDADHDAETGNAYGCFVALGAYQELGRELPEPLRMVQCLKFLETPDDAWANARGLKIGSTNATAAAVTLLHQLGMPIHQSVGDWLLAQVHTDGGFLAMPNAPLPDLLSTATALHALSCLEREVPAPLRERCLDFIDTLWDAEGGFHGHWADDQLDAEYTFYGLLALGHLSV